MSIAAFNGPIANAFSNAMRWAHCAEKRRYTHPHIEGLRLRLWEKVKGIRSLMGGWYVCHPMDPWNKSTKMYPLTRIQKERLIRKNKQKCEKRLRLRLSLDVI